MFSKKLAKEKTKEVCLRIRGPLAHYAFHIVHDRAEVENILVFAFGKAYENLGALPKDDNGITAYLFKLVHKASVGLLSRRMGQAPSNISAPKLADWLDAEGGLRDRNLTVEEILERLNCLDKEIRGMAGCMISCGLNSKEIAEIWGVTASNAETGMPHVRETLRKRIEEAQNEGKGLAENPG